MSFLDPRSRHFFLHRTTPRIALLAGLAAALTLGLAADAARAQSVKTDLGVYQKPAAPPLPASGGKWVDATFGAEVMRVTDEATTGGRNAGTSYSYWPTFNSDNTRLLVMQDGSSSGLIYEFDPAGFTLGSHYEIPPIPGGGGQVIRGEDAIWSSRDPAILYAHTDAGAKLWAYNVNTRAFTLVADLSARLLPGGLFISQMSKSDDDDVFAATVRRGDPDWAFLGYIVYRVSTDTVLQQGVSVIDECQIDKTGRYLYIQTAKQGAGQIYGRVLDVRTGAIQELLDPAPDHAPGHADSGAGSIVGGSHHLNAITRRDHAAPHVFNVVFDFRDSWNNPNHLSMLAANEEWVLGSFYGSADGGVYAGLFRGEIVQIRTDGSQQVRRLLHHHSVLHGYYDSPRANVSRDGRFVAFTSNWGGRQRRDLFVARVEAAPSTNATPTPTPTATATPTPTATATPTPSPFLSAALVAAAHDRATAMANAEGNNDAQFDALLASIGQAYAVFAAEQSRVVAGDQIEKALRTSHYFALASRALARSRNYPLGVHNRLQIAASRLGQARNLLASQASVGPQAEQAHAPSTSAPPVIGAARTLSAASLLPVLAPASLGTIIGDPEQSPLASAAAGAAKLSLDALPSELAGASVTIGGVAAPLAHAAPGRISFYVPAGLAAGEAEVIVTSQDGYVSRGTVVVMQSAPGLFTRDAAGAGVAFNTSGESADSFDVASPHNLSADKRTRVTFFATGVSSNPALNFHADNDIYVGAAPRLANLAESFTVEARAADGRVWGVPVEFVGAVGSVAGVDQVTVLLHPEMRGAGRVALTLVAAGGQRSNPASIHVR